MIARRLPPLNALRVYEAAARHLSFQQAAQELHVTPSAVSHQIKLLETFLGVPLFRRRTRQVLLTPEGQALLPSIRSALDQIADAIARVGVDSAPRPLTVSVAPTFATEWLVPRLAGFQAEHPEIDVRLTTAREVPDFAATDIDLAIPYGTGPWPKFESCMLMHEELVPLCAPALTTGPRALRSPQDLRHATLIHVLPRARQWPELLTAAGLTGIAAERGLTFQSTTLALEAAMSGAGVALANRVLVAHHLEAGRLVIPFDLQLPSSGGYHLVYPKSNANEPRIVAFRGWLEATLRAEGRRAASQSATADG